MGTLSCVATVTMTLAPKTLGRICHVTCTRTQLLRENGPCNTTRRPGGAGGRRRGRQRVEPAGTEHPEYVVEEGHCGGVRVACTGVRGV
jgi:hypothetical protein